MKLLPLSVILCYSTENMKKENSSTSTLLLHRVKCLKAR